MTMIDPATGWFEIAPVIEPNSDTTQRILDAQWLARYPRPQEIGYDNGNEFKWLFDQLATNFGLKKKNTTDYNPQSNAIIERAHQVLGNCLRTFQLDEQDLNQPNPFEPFLTAAACAIRSTCHTTLKATPGQLVLGGDMMLPIQHITNWTLIAQRKKALANESNMKENKSRQEFNYQPGQRVPHPNLVGCVLNFLYKSNSSQVNA